MHQPRVGDLGVGEVDSNNITLFIPLDLGSQLLQRLYGIDFRSAPSDDVVLILFTKLSQRYFDLLSVGALKVHHTFRKRKKLSFDGKFS